MEGLQRPECQARGIGECLRPATRIVCFERTRHWFFSCKDCAEKWHKRGGYWIGHLLGRMPDPLED
jgi:hypothetical protein